MTVKYKIHWISMWNYVINQNLLDREFFVKWWDSFKTTDIISKLHDDFPSPVQRAIAHCTRSRSSLDCVQIAGKSSKELKDLAQQLLLQSKQLESEEKNSPASSEASCNRIYIYKIKTSASSTIFHITFFLFFLFYIILFNLETYGYFLPCLYY